MPQITYVAPDGTETKVEVVAGTTVKDAALEHGVDGIVAECGGNAMCATCHVYVAGEWADALPRPDDVEDGLLDGTASPRRPTSRLGCQVQIGYAQDGLIVHLPETQE